MASSIIGIVAIDHNNAIGRGGAVPWHYSADMKFFREQTTGHACVMGRKTWLSLAGPLKNRLNIVMSRSHEVDAQESVIVLRDRVSVLSLQPYLACDLVIIGGEQIYRTFTPYIEKWMVTRVPLSVPDADTFMSPDFLDGFALSESRELEANLLVNFYQKL